jgi:hypothetical protein
MKRLFLAAILATAVFVAANATPDKKVNPKTLSTFQNAFSSATDVRWTATDDVVKANFSYLGTRTEAYFNADGELIGTARNVLYSQLPMAVTKEIEKRWGPAGVYEITEYYDNEGTGYMMTVDLGKKKLQIRSTASGDIWVVKKMK